MKATRAVLAGVIAFGLAGLGPVAATAQQAPAPQLSLPIDCQVHVNCWVVHYFDTDPGPGATDYQDGFRTYNNHDGTDFAISGIEAMEAGVPVIAAADGSVRARRDGMEDVNLRVIGREAVRGRECGNGAVVTHGPGWATQYCHLRKGSIRVGKGQQVKRGDVIGFVGLSGLTEFPHVHFNVFRSGKKIDPFAPENSKLWTQEARRAMDYRPVSIFATGFRESVPDKAKVRLGDIRDQSILTSSPAILFWTGIFGVREGDVIKQTLRDPDGRILAEREIVQSKNQIRRFLWVGKKRRARTWPAGTYTGEVSVTPAEGAHAGYRKSASIDITRN